MSPTLLRYGPHRFCFFSREEPRIHVHVTSRRRRGALIAGPEIVNISRFGVWIVVAQSEYFAPFAQFPWFGDASVAHILNVREPHPGHLFWPDLDVDPCVASLAAPDRFPLVARTSAVKAGRARR